MPLIRHVVGIGDVVAAFLLALENPAQSDRRLTSRRVGVFL